MFNTFQAGGIFVRNDYLSPPCLQDKKIFAGKPIVSGSSELEPNSDASAAGKAQGEKVLLDGENNCFSLILCLGVSISRRYRIHRILRS